MSVYIAAKRRAELLLELEMERFARPTPLPQPIVSSQERLAALRKLVRLVAEGLEDT